MVLPTMPVPRTAIRMMESPFHDAYSRWIGRGTLPPVSPGRAQVPRDTTAIPKLSPHSRVGGSRSTWAPTEASTGRWRRPEPTSARTSGTLSTGLTGGSRDQKQPGSDDNHPEGSGDALTARCDTFD